MATSGRHKVGQATPYRQQVYPPRYTSGVHPATTKASITPSTSQGHDVAAGGDGETRVGPPPEDPQAGIGEIGPPPEDLGKDTEASRVKIPWMMSPNMWPLDGGETSPTY